jgi:hypothetical protein
MPSVLAADAAIALSLSGIILSDWIAKVQHPLPALDEGEHGTGQSCTNSVPVRLQFSIYPESDDGGGAM